MHLHNYQHEIQLPRSFRCSVFPQEELRSPNCYRNFRRNRYSSVREENPRTDYNHSTGSQASSCQMHRYRARNGDREGDVSGKTMPSRNNNQNPYAYTSQAMRCQRDRHCYEKDSIRCSKTISGNRNSRCSDPKTIPCQMHVYDNGDSNSKRPSYLHEVSVSED